MKLSKSQTKYLQGIAILFMLGLHLFNRTDIKNYYDVCLYLPGGTSLLTAVSYIFDACVPIYLFCSGYGLFISESKGSDWNKRFTRIWKLLVRFWIVMILTCCVGFAMGMQDKFPGSLWNIILNATLIKSSYVGAFWFIQTYVLLVLLAKWFYKCVEKYPWWILVGVSGIGYVFAFVIEMFILNRISMEMIGLVVRAMMLLLRSQFTFLIGMLFAKGTWLDQNKILSRIRNSIWMPWVGLTAIITIRANVCHMIFAPVSAIVLIVLFGTYRWGRIGKNVLQFFGNHSTNIWLTHMQFYMIFTPALVFASRNVFVIMMTLIVLSLMASFVVNSIYNLIMSITLFLHKKN